MKANVFWIAWCAFFCGYEVARQHWLFVGIQAVCCALWVYWTVIERREARL